MLAAFGEEALGANQKPSWCIACGGSSSRMVWGSGLCGGSGICWLTTGLRAR
jgi:hypothetical protein